MAKGQGVGLIQNYKGMDYLGHFRNPAVLKSGHNQGAPGMTTEDGGGMQTPKPQSTVKSAQKEMLGAKDTPSWQAAKQKVTEAKAGRKEAYKEFGQAKAALKSEGYGGGRGKALKAAKQNLKQNYAGSFKNYQAQQAAKRDSGGGFFGKIGKMFGGSAGEKIGSKVGGVAKKVGGAGKKSMGM